MNAFGFQEKDSMTTEVFTGFNQGPGQQNTPFWRWEVLPRKVVP
jgi:hypothetical protein